MCQFNNLQDYTDYIWQELRLDQRCITFSVIDVGEDRLYFERGIIDCAGDLWESEALDEIGAMRCDDQTIEVNSVESYVSIPTAKAGGFWESEQSNSTRLAYAAAML